MVVILPNKISMLTAVRPEGLAPRILSRDPDRCPYDRAKGDSFIMTLRQELAPLPMQRFLGGHVLDKIAGRVTAGRRVG